MNRRRFLLVACAVAAGFGARAARARDAKRVRRIVYFGVRRSDVPSVLRDLVRFRDELRGFRAAARGARIAQAALASSSWR